MVNKGGWIRIVEATIAILIIFVALFLVSETKRAQTESDLSTTITPLLEEIAKNNSLRDKIMANPQEAEGDINSFIEARIKEPNIEHAARVCDINEICGLLGKYPEAKGNVYAGSRLISSSLSSAQPKKVALFLWIKA